MLHAIISTEASSDALRTTDHWLCFQPKLRSNRGSWASVVRPKYAYFCVGPLGRTTLVRVLADRLAYNFFEGGHAVEDGEQARFAQGAHAALS